MILFSGNANPLLAHKISQHLDLALGRAHVGRFSDGEILVEIQENVRGKDVFIIQPTCAPTNDMLMELVIMADAFRRASAKRITAVVPYVGALFWLCPPRQTGSLCSGAYYGSGRGRHDAFCGY
jgi:ribose-phosphate pyrophosphokinase